MANISAVKATADRRIWLENPIVRVEDEFECLKTLWVSPRMTLQMEVLRLILALIMQLAGITGNRPEALLELKYKHIAVAF